MVKAKIVIGKAHKTTIFAVDLLDWCTVKLGFAYFLKV